MEDEHKDIAILHTMAKQVSNINERIGEYERVLKIIIDNQTIIVNQELFLIRNEQHKVIESSKKATYSEVTRNATTNKTKPPNSSTPLEKSLNEVVIDKQSEIPQKTNKTLFIGDSVSTNVDIALLEKATETKFVTAKAYTSIHDTVQNAAKNSARFPKSNFTDVIMTELNKDEYEIGQICKFV